MFCDRCQFLFDSEPLGALSRKYNKQNLDANGQSKALCRQCSEIVSQTNNFCTQYSSFEFVNPDKYTTEEQKEQHDADINTHNNTHNITAASILQLDTHAFDSLRLQHEDEMISRVRWCLDNNLVPAHEHVHLAPGDDSKFMVNFIILHVNVYEIWRFSWCFIKRPISCSCYFCIHFLCIKCTMYCFCIVFFD